ncbi:unnamed protein product, partial [Tilletia caries]
MTSPITSSRRTSTSNASEDSHYGSPPEGPIPTFPNYDKVKVMAYAHEELGHRGRDAMTALLLERFWWESIRGDCAKHARSCATCQRRSRETEVEAQRSTPIPRLFEDFALDIVDTGTGTGLRRYLVIARDLLT